MIYQDISLTEKHIDNRFHSNSLQKREKKRVFLGAVTTNSRARHFFLPHVPYGTLCIQKKAIFYLNFNTLFLELIDFYIKQIFPKHNIFVQMAC